jgi:class 3 adenylate cyclase/tetratricopeptide (TPR) repeat protein
MPETADSRLSGRLQAWLRELPHDVRGGLLAPHDGENRLVTAVFIAVRPCGAPRGAAVSAVADAFISSLREALQLYQGRVDRVIGDGVIALFGSPTAHEDDPERAILAAMHVRGGSRGRGARVAAGVCTGSVRFGTLGDDEHHEAGAIGPVPSLAVALCARARQGQILLSESTARLVRHAYALEPVPAPRAGQPLPPASRVLRGIERASKPRGIDGLRSGIIGRGAEMRRLRAALGQAMDGRGKIIVITGEAGLGKSRLVAELRAHAAALPRPPLWLEGRCVELGMSTPYGPLVEALSVRLGLGQAGRTRSRAARLAEALAALQRGGTLTAAQRARIQPLLGWLLGVLLPSRQRAAMESGNPEILKHQVILAIRDLLRALCRSGPAVLCLDDLHWADVLTVEAATLLVESLASWPLLLVCAYRPEPGAGCARITAAAARARPGRLVRVELRELTPMQGRRMVHSLLGAGSMPGGLLDSIIDNAQGNPFYVEEVIRSLIDGGVIHGRDGKWRTSLELPRLALPGSLHAVIMSRVGRLEDDGRRVLEAAAVLGRAFLRSELELMLGRTGLVARLGSLEERALISRDPRGAEGAYAFRHVLTHQAVYDDIPRARRARLHREAARAIERVAEGSLDERSEQLARHHARAGDAARAVDCLLRAGCRAADAFLTDGALSLLQEALVILEARRTPMPLERMRVLTEMGRVYEGIGRHDLSVARLREASILCRGLGTPLADLLRINFTLAKALTASHRPQEYLPVSRQTLDALRDRPDCIEAIHAEFVQAYAEFDHGDFGAFCRFADIRGPLIRSFPYAQELMINCGILAWSYAVEREEEKAEDWLRWLEREAGRRADPLILAAVKVRWGRDLYAQQGDRLHALASLREAIGLYAGIGARYLEARGRLFTGDVLYRFGLLDDAEVELREAQRLCALLVGHGHLAAESSLLEGQIALGRGRTAEALASFTAGLASSPGEQWALYLRYLTGCAHLAAGNHAEAARALLALLDAPHASRVPPAFALAVEPVHVLGILESCRNAEALRAAYGRAAAHRPPSDGFVPHWRLERSEPSSRSLTTEQHPLIELPVRGWAVVDPHGDCQARFTRQGLAIHAPLGRGLWGLNHGSPRLSRPFTGDGAVEVDTVPLPGGGTAVGGLGIWVDRRNYVRLDRGATGAGAVCLSACVDNREQLIGRGRLDGQYMRLRLERAGQEASALCSTDGGRWWSIGRLPFPVDGPAELFLFVDSAVRPELYPVSFAAGAGLLFSNLTVFAPT